MISLVLIFQVDALDPDTGVGGRLRYSCDSDCSDGDFEVSPLSGEVLVADFLDADTSNTHQKVISVIVTDGGGKSSIAKVTITGTYLHDSMKHTTGFIHAVSLE